jgi:tetratricopeptide (TPR) repeat protein
MPRPSGPWSVIGWLATPGPEPSLAGAAFLIGADILVTCAHVIRDDLGLPSPTPRNVPTDRVVVRFEALESESTGRVLRNGWFPDSARSRDGLSDIAIVRLQRPVDGITIPAIARTIPNQQFDTFVFGAEPGYERIGQEIQVKIGGNPNPKGWRPLDSPPTGFSVKRGFSGAPTMDGLGNTVWGMIAAVDAGGERVSFAITADHLWQALRRAGAQATAGVRIADKADANARRAMAALRDRVAGMEVESKQKEAESRQKEAEIARLQEMVRSFEQRERTTRGVGPEGRALQSLAQGDALPATDILRERIREQRAEAAAASWQLGSLLSLTDAAAALEAYHEAALLNPDDFLTLMAVGDREMQAGTLKEAARAYQRAYTVAARYAKADPNSNEWRHNVGLSQESIGDVHMERIDYEAALTAYHKSLDIRIKLSEDDPLDTEWQRSLSVSYNRIGDVHLAEGHRDLALDAYEKDLEIAARLAVANPTDIGSRRDLAVSYERVGDVRMEQHAYPAAREAYQQSLTIRKKLAEDDPSDTDRQRDLSVSYNKIGNVCLAERGYKGALDAYSKDLGIASALAAGNQTNTGRQRDLAVSHERIGDVHMAQGAYGEAISAYQKSLKIRQGLIKIDSGNPSWQGELAWVRRRITEAQKHTAR